MSMKATIKRLKEFGIHLDGFGDLSIIADKYGSDKGFQGGEGHLYTKFYESIFNEIRFKKFTIVEIGLLSAHWQKDFQIKGYDGLYANVQDETYHDYPSLKMWAEFFPFADIIGLDKENFIIDPSDRRIRFHKFDANEPQNIVNIISSKKPMVIIDDASHIYKHQQDTFFHAFEYLEDGGAYIIEDLRSLQGDFIPGYPRTVDVFSKGAEGLRECPSYNYDPERGERIISMISALRFSNSLRTGEINTLCIKKK